MPDREYGGGSYNSGYGSASRDNTRDSVRAGDTPGFGTGGGGSVGGGGGYGSSGGLLSGGGDRGGRDTSDTAAQQAAANAARIAAERATYEQQQAQALAAQRAAFQAQQQAAVQAALQKQAQEEAAQRARVQAQQAAAVQAAIERKAQRDATISNYVSKMISVESGGDPFAKAKGSSATGLAQFTDGTWMQTVGKYRPDLLEGRSKKEVLALRTDPNLSMEMAGNLATENADFLESRGLPVNEGTLHLSHFLGAGDAAKVLRANPDTPIGDLVQERSITANPTILGGGRTAADVTQWASNLIGRAPAFDLANMPASGASAAGTTTPSIRYGYKPGEGTFAPPQVEAAKPAGFLDQIFGGPQALNQRIADLEAAGMTSTYPDQSAAYAKQAYANDFAGGDISKVKSRIVDFGQGPVVDYYVKDLGDVAGEAISGLLGGVGKLFGGASEKPYLGAESDRASSIAPGSIFGNLFSGTPRADYGPYGNLTAEQYRQQYGGRDVAQLSPAAQTPVAPVAAPQPTQQFAGIPTAEELARSPYLWREYYNRLPQNYGMQMVQAPLIGPTIRGIFS